MGKINIPTVFDWIPVYNEVTTLISCLIHVSRMLVELKPAQYTTNTLWILRLVSGTSRLFLSKRKTNPIQTNPAIKHRLLQRLMSLSANFAAKTIILMPSAVPEPLSSPTIRTAQSEHSIDSKAYSRLVKAVGNRELIPNFKELKALMSKAGQSSGPSSSAAKPSKSSKEWKSKGTYVSTILPIKLHLLPHLIYSWLYLLLFPRRRQREAVTWMPCWTLVVSPEIL